jgi:beta-N-acetylglucosaminidase
VTRDPAIPEGWFLSGDSLYYLEEDGSLARDAVLTSTLAFPLTPAGALADASVSTLSMGSVTVPAMARMMGTDSEHVAAGGIGAGALLQFKDLRDPNPEGITAAQIDEFIARYCGYSETEVFYVRSSLRGQGQAFLDASRSAGVNVVYLVCHALNESAWGCSELACGNSWTDPQDGKTGVYYNYFGYAAVDDNPYDGGMRWAKEHGWTSPAAAIAGGAEAISRSWVNNVASPQRTLYEMRWDPAYAARNHEAGWHLYATDDDFCVTVGYLMAWLCDDEGVTPSLNLIVPVYAR